MSDKEFDYEYMIKELLYEKVTPLCEDNNIDIYVMRKKGIADINDKMNHPNGTFMSLKLD